MREVIAMAINSTKIDEKSVEKNKLQTLKRLYSYLFAYKWQLTLVLLIMAFGMFASLINPKIIQVAIDDYITPGNIDALYKLVAFVVVLNLLVVVADKIRMYVMAKVCNEILLTIRQELYTHIQKLDFAFFDSRPTGKILSRIIGDINSLKDVLSNSVTTLIPNVCTVACVAVIMVFMNWKLAIACMLTLPVMVSATVFIEKHAHKHWSDFRKKSSNLNAFLHEDMAGMRIIQSFNAQEETEETFDELVGAHRKTFLKACSFSDAFGPVIDFSWALGSILLYVTGIVIIGRDNITVGEIFAFGSYLYMFFWPIQNIASFYNNLVTNIAAADRVFEILDTEPDIADASDVTTMPEIKGNVTFENVSFSYDDHTKVLENVSFDIKAGETIALVGPTGAGKSTIVNLISRFYDVQEGRVLVDGIDVKKVSIESLRQQMGIMTQDNFLFTGTIRENIRYGRLDATDEEIEAAAKAVNAHEFIMKLDKGYDTELKERGGGLSIGQKQLLAFARTMVSMPKILILDEATSSIDTKTERLVQNGIEHLLAGRTSFVIAHRLSTIEKADRIFVVDEGGICEEGTAKELMAKKGMYYNLYMAQFADIA